MRRLPSDALIYARDHRQRFLADLLTFIRFPTISARTQHADDLKRCANWLADQLRGAGLESVRVIPTPKHPIVYGHWKHAEGRPTVLVYGHYDVQPPDPIREWRSPPFEPTLHGDDLYARGASDDKGQLLTHVKAIEAYLRTSAALPVNVKCLFEGEEEIGSPNLIPFVGCNQRELAADVAVMSDTRMLSPDQPAISYSERGALNLEVEVRGPEHDLHSGNFGGAIHNPIQALCEIISKLHDVDGHVTVPGFYTRVRKWSRRERTRMLRDGPSNEDILREAGVKRSWGEHGYTVYERTTLRPSLAVTGLVGGYQGPGVKGVIPARAVAKLNLRLVPDQDPLEIAPLFRQQIARLTPSTVSSRVRMVSAARPVLLDPRHPALRDAAFAYRKAFGVTPVFVRSGGTIPVANTFQEILRVPTVLMGFGLPDDRIHAPNEKFHLPNFYNGIATSIWFLAVTGVRRHPMVGRKENQIAESLSAVYALI
jgi:acetylornithine deacetylase/succinyl-diaminopimelate desuccinylase-like protein